MGDGEHEVEEGMQTMGDPRAEKSQADLANMNVNGSRVNEAFEMDNKRM